MKSRRRLLKLGAAVVSTSAVAASGCLEEEVGDEEPEDDETGDGPDDEPDESDEGAEDELAAARQSFGEAATELERIVKDEDYSFDDTDVRGALEEGGEYLDEAHGANPTEEQERQAHDLRQLRRSLDTVIDSAEQMGEGLDDFDVALEHYDENNFDAAIGRLRDAQGEFRRADGSLGRAEEQFEEIESEIDRHDEIDADAIRDVINKYRSWTGAMEGMSDGMRDLSRGFERFFRATDDWEQENWRGAERDFDRAHDLFEDSSSTFLETEEDVPPEFLDEMSDLTCEAEAMTDATDHFSRSMEAAQDGDWDSFETEVDRGEEAAERCD